MTTRRIAELASEATSHIFSVTGLSQFETAETEEYLIDFLTDVIREAHGIIEDPHPLHYDSHLLHLIKRAKG